MYVEFLSSQKYNGVRYQPGEVVNFSKENVLAVNYLASMQAMGRILIHQELPERLSGATIRDAEKRPAPEPVKAKPAKKAAKKAPAKKAAPKKEEPEAKAPAKKAAKRAPRKAKQVIKE